MLANELRETLQKVCAILNKNGVEYILVGGTAVGYYGYRRVSGITVIKPDMTTDLDFWYRPSLSNYQNILQALSELGVDISSLADLIFDPKKTFLKISHTYFHMNFLPQMKGLASFEECKKRASEESLDGNRLYILSLSDLLENKKAVGRPSDQNDITNL
ncbi:MAG: hypothetical protein ACOYXA_08705 [Bacteroidota bacterium]